MPGIAYVQEQDAQGIAVAILYLSGLSDLGLRTADSKRGGRLVSATWPRVAARREGGDADIDVWWFAWARWSWVFAAGEEGSYPGGAPPSTIPMEWLNVDR